MHLTLKPLQYWPWRTDRKNARDEHSLCINESPASKIQSIAQPASATAWVPGDIQVNGTLEIVPASFILTLWGQRQMFANERPFMH